MVFGEFTVAYNVLDTDRKNATAALSSKCNNIG